MAFYGGKDDHFHLHGCCGAAEDMPKLLQYVHNMYSDNCNLQFAFALHVLEIRIKAWQTLLGNILDRAPLGKLYSLAVDGSTCTQANAGFFISL